MLVHFDQAPGDTFLTITGIDNPELAERLKHLGISPGDKVLRLNVETALGPVRVQGPGGEVVLAEGMASKIIAHHDDGHKTPLLEMEPGEQGHVEGLVCGSALEKGLEVLGIRTNDRLRMLRRVPPMQYHVRMESKRESLTEGQAAKIWIREGERRMQLATAPTGKPLFVEKLLGGRRALTLLHTLGISPGSVLTLENVTPAQALGGGGRNRIVLATPSGLRLYLRPEQARQIRVKQ